MYALAGLAEARKVRVSEPLFALCASSQNVQLGALALNLLSLKQLLMNVLHVELLRRLCSILFSDSKEQLRSGATSSSVDSYAWLMSSPDNFL